MRTSTIRCGIVVALSVGCVLLGTSTPRGVIAGDQSPALRDVHRAEQRPQAKEFRLRLHHAHTEENLNVVYRRGSKYLAGGIQRLNHFLRDYRTGEDAHYDVREFDLLYQLMQRLHRPNGTIDVLCGYRSPATNASLRERESITGAAENSLHMQSKAIDIRVPGVSTKRLRDAALSLHMGGVGYYPAARFVHVDVGPVRQWTFVAAARARAARRLSESRDDPQS